MMVRLAEAEAPRTVRGSSYCLLLQTISNSSICLEVRSSFLVVWEVWLHPLKPLRLRVPAW